MNISDNNARNKNFLQQPHYLSYYSATEHLIVSAGISSLSTVIILTWRLVFGQKNTNRRIKPSY